MAIKYTNEFNLPERIFRWLIADEYDYQPGTISATTLIAPARAWALKQRHPDDLTVDCSTLIASRYGTAIHDSLEKVGVFNNGDFVEQRFFAEFMGFTICGKMDAVICGVIHDNKSTSVWKFVHGEFDDYVKQLSIYRWLLYKNAIPTADHAFIDFFFTDWKKSDAAKGGNYPPLRYQEQRIELMSIDDTEAYIADRLYEFAFAQSCLPECTPEELWQTDNKWAVYKGNSKLRAFRLCDSAEEAGIAAAECGGTVEARPGKVKRCAYCIVSQFCDQYKRMKDEGLIDE